MVILLLLLTSIAFADTVVWQSGRIWEKAQVHSIVVDGSMVKVNATHTGRTEWLASAAHIDIGTTGTEVHAPTPIAVIGTVLDGPPPVVIPVAESEDDIQGLRDANVPVMRVRNRIFYRVGGMYRSEDE